MRVSRLDLLRFGHFTDCQLVFPAADRDLHVVFGPNEAGKSTTLAALEDLLFEIQDRSPHNFLHEYKAMRLGAWLQGPHAELDFVRRKGKKDRLLDREGVPMADGEARLAALLAGADRAFFQRMFSLDHGRLRAGGEEILKAQGDVGQILFSAGAGIAGLRQRTQDYDEETDRLWGPRRAGHRAFNQAEDRYNEARKRLNTVRVTSKAWSDLKRAFQEAEDLHQQSIDDIRALKASQHRLARIRRVIRPMRQRAELQARIAEVGPVADFPPDAGPVYREARQAIRDATHHIDILAEQRAGLVQDRDALQIDEAVLRRGDEIEALHERRIQVAGELSDLPKRQNELADAERRVRQYATIIEWDVEDLQTLIDRVPTREDVAALRGHVNRYGELAERQKNEADRLAGFETQRADHRRRLDALPDLQDLRELDALMADLGSKADLPSQLEAQRAELASRENRVSRQLARLHPAIASVERLRALAVPVAAEILACRDRARDLAQQGVKVRNDMDALRAEQDRLGLERDSLLTERELVDRDMLMEARSTRDALWRELRDRYVVGDGQDKLVPRADAGEPDEVAERYAEAVAHADRLADRRFATAEAMGELTALNRAIAETDGRIKTLNVREQELAERETAELDAWNHLWRACSFEPLSPEAMLEWVALRDDILEQAEQHDREADKLKDLQEREIAALSGLRVALTSLGVDMTPSGEAGLGPALAFAAAEQSRMTAVNAARAGLQERLEELDRQVAQCKTQEKEAARLLIEWQTERDRLVGIVALDPGLPMDVIVQRIEIFDQMREAAVEFATLKTERIDKIQRDHETFCTSVRDLARTLAPHLGEEDAMAAALAMEDLLAETRQMALKRRDIDAAIGTLDETIDNHRQERARSADSVRHLLEGAGLKETSELDQAIDRFERVARLRNDLTRIEADLQENGEGLSIEALTAECSGADPDVLAADEQAMNEELQALQDRQLDNRERLKESRSAFEAVGGDDAAVRAEADRQAALAEMESVAEHYVRARSASIMLRWAIDRYRREKQGPLLERASGLFSTLTGGSFAGLQIQFGADDAPELAGIRADESLVAVDGMSEGTVDQLYLALRVAAVEDYLERADPLPFVADDLFINFDDDRARAGFKVLGELARRCQVIFFTHHRHLVDVAREALGADLSAIDLSAR